MSGICQGGGNLPGRSRFLIVCSNYLCAYLQPRKLQPLKHREHNKLTCTDAAAASIQFISKSRATGYRTDCLSDSNVVASFFKTVVEYAYPSDKLIE